MYSRLMVCFLEHQYILDHEETEECVCRALVNQNPRDYAKERIVQS